MCGDAHVYKCNHFLVVGPIGSRMDYATFLRNKEGIIKVVCGCFYGTINEFLAKVDQTHGNSKHMFSYRAASELARVQIDTSEIDDSK